MSISFDPRWAITRSFSISNMPRCWFGTQLFSLKFPSLCGKTKWKMAAVIMRPTNMCNQSRWWNKHKKPHFIIVSIWQYGSLITDHSVEHPRGFFCLYFFCCLLLTKNLQHAASWFCPRVGLFGFSEKCTHRRFTTPVYLCERLVPKRGDLWTPAGGLCSFVSRGGAFTSEKGPNTTKHSNTADT